jgi:hypothetical protein
METLGESDGHAEGTVARERERVGVPRLDTLLFGPEEVGRLLKIQGLNLRE